MRAAAEISTNFAATSLEIRQVNRSAKKGSDLAGVLVGFHVCGLGGVLFRGREHAGGLGGVLSVNISSTISWIFGSLQVSTPMSFHFISYQIKLLLTNPLSALVLLKPSTSQQHGQLWS